MNVNKKQESIPVNTGSESISSNDNERFEQGKGVGSNLGSHFFEPVEYYYSDGKPMNQTEASQMKGTFSRDFSLNEMNNEFITDSFFCTTTPDPKTESPSFVKYNAHCDDHPEISGHVSSNDKDFAYFEDKSENQPLVTLPNENNQVIEPLSSQSCKSQLSTQNYSESDFGWNQLCDLDPIFKSLAFTDDTNLFPAFADSEAALIMLKKREMTRVKHRAGRPRKYSYVNKDLNFEEGLPRRRGRPTGWRKYPEKEEIYPTLSPRIKKPRKVFDAVVIPVTIKPSIYTEPSLPHHIDWNNGCSEEFDFEPSREDEDFPDLTSDSTGQDPLSSEPTIFDISPLPSDMEPTFSENSLITINKMAIEERKQSRRLEQPLAESQHQEDLLNPYGVDQDFDETCINESEQQATHIPNSSIKFNYDYTPPKSATSHKHKRVDLLASRKENVWTGLYGKVQTEMVSNRGEAVLNENNSKNRTNVTKPNSYKNSVLSIGNNHSNHSNIIKPNTYKNTILSNENNTPNYSNVCLSTSLINRSLPSLKSTMHPGVNKDLITRPFKNVNKMSVRKALIKPFHPPISKISRTRLTVSSPERLYCAKPISMATAPSETDSKLINRIRNLELEIGGLKEQLSVVELALDTDKNSKQIQVVERKIQNWRKSAQLAVEVLFPVFSLKFTTMLQEVPQSVLRTSANDLRTKPCSIGTYLEQLQIPFHLLQYNSETESWDLE
ncbi:DNA recombination mediator Swi2 [Schizosaccharomyces pombe]|uniref:Mating-type switching protein swi2 n=3 Tax=Schizosaccharomyces pombe TaxID=4896 RepID=SWI2_SCHPO|nr:Swi5 complex subunit Swi2 [Schizosaccharomyces pombe]Q10668.1 RecName: Full=Mating-type switching protein swi2 [Schizosaccharomyces pombe 972h-]AEX61006.1 Swi2L [Schizosaccharomyces pombe]CAA63788.1 swi2 [Schizosaccharomyces pombe]CAB77010.1 Swi5 complex subunit Swi2 [Schizosaccharomyces pombe]|eukprot:NP_001018264.1 Swi5 complex subunit Swi2 [Schizosaccharomyces pombe]